MTQQASLMLDEIKVAADEIKVVAEMGVTATEPDVPAGFGYRLHFIDADDFKPITRRILEKLRLPEINIGWQRNWSTDESHIDLESGFKTDVVSKCKCSCWEKCPKCDGYGQSENDLIERIVKELKDKNIAFEFISAEMVNRLKENGRALNVVETVKKLKDEGCELLCLPVAFVKKLMVNVYGLEFIPFEAVEMWSDYGRALMNISVEMVQKLKEDGYALFVPVKMVRELNEDGRYALINRVEMVEKLKDGDYVEMESGFKTDVVCKCPWFQKCPKCDGYGQSENDRSEMESGDITEEVVKWRNQLERITKCFGYANDYIEKTLKPEIGILFSGGTMQNIYQLLASGMLTTRKGKMLMKLNETAFMMLLYGLVMPRRAAGNFALATGVALASAAYLVTMSFAF